MTNVLTKVLVALLLVGASVAGVVVYLNRGDDDKPTIDPAMLVAARQEATNFFDLDYQDADGSIQRVLDLATGTFKQSFSDSSAKLRTTMMSAKVVCKASIPDQGSAVEFVDGDHAQVLVVVAVQESKSCGLFDLSNRTRVVLVREGGRWLVSDLNRVG